MSELSDIPEKTSSNNYQDQEFHEGLKSIYETVHPGLTSPKKIEPIPTHLIPFPYAKPYDKMVRERRSSSSHSHSSRVHAPQHTHVQ